MTPWTLTLDVTPAVGLAVLISVALALVLLGVWLAGRWSSARSRDRNVLARRGECEAESLLERAGYRVVGRQVTARWCLAIDGREVQVAVRADLVVQRAGQRFVAEVKTGERAPDPRLPATRRQLLEYCLAFGASQVLLVDVPSRCVHVVSFPDVEFDEDVPSVLRGTPRLSGRRAAQRV